jgi:hypothetical protein
MVEIIIGLEDRIGKELLSLRDENNIIEIIPLIRKYYSIKDKLLRNDIIADVVHDDIWYENESMKRIRLLVESGYWNIHYISK